MSPAGDRGPTPGEDVAGSGTDDLSPEGPGLAGSRRGRDESLAGSRRPTDADGAEATPPAGPGSPVSDPAIPGGRDAGLREPGPAESGHPDADPPDPGHAGCGITALVGVVLLVAVGAAQTWRIARAPRPPPPVGAAALRGLVEDSVEVHFRGPRGGGPPAPGARPAGFGLETALPAGWPPPGFDVTDHAVRARDGGAVYHRRYRRGDDHASLLVRPRPPELPPGRFSLGRGGLGLRVLAEERRVVVWVAPAAVPAPGGSPRVRPSALGPGGSPRVRPPGPAPLGSSPLRTPATAPPATATPDRRPTASR